VYFAAAWLWGSNQRVRTQRLGDLVANAERERVAAAEAVGREERTRIARELHGVIAHHLSLMVIQAGGARRLVEHDPGRAREALAVIEEYGRRGLEAMPGLLKALLSEPEAESRMPPPRLADVATLVDHCGGPGRRCS
jgi:signal transduction histidine kinase